MENPGKSFLLWNRGSNGQFSINSEQLTIKIGSQQRYSLFITTILLRITTLLLRYYNHISTVFQRYFYPEQTNYEPTNHKQRSHHTPHSPLTGKCQRGTGNFQLTMSNKQLRQALNSVTTYFNLVSTVFLPYFHCISANFYVPINSFS